MSNELINNIKTDITKEKRSLISIIRSIMDNESIMDLHTRRTISNIISNNFLPEWSVGYKHLYLDINTNNTDIEFIPPRLDEGDFLERFINGRERLSERLHRSPNIQLNISDKLIKSSDNPEDIFNLLKNAVEYYDHGIDAMADSLFYEVGKLDTATKKLILTTDMIFIVTLPLQLLFVFDDVDIHTNPFIMDNDVINTINRFVKTITIGNTATPEDKKVIIDEMRAIVSNLKSGITYNESTKLFWRMDKIVEDFYNGTYDNVKKMFFEQFADDQCRNMSVFIEGRVNKRLKKIPSDLVSYISVEGESIKDANDKMMILSYAYGKLEIVEWYIELLEVGTSRYIVPHTRDELISIRIRLLAAIKKIENTPIPAANRPIISIQYPKGYEG